jgi:hypothetical protein
MRVTRYKLQFTGYRMLHEYLDHLVADAVGLEWVVKRFHWERKTWTRHDERLASLRNEIQEAGESFVQAFRAFTAPTQAKVQYVNSRLQRWTDQANAGVDMSNQPLPTVATFDKELSEIMTQTFDRLIARLDAAHGYLVWQRDYIHSLTFQSLQLKNFDQRFIRERYGSHLAHRLQNNHIKFAAETIRQITTVKAAVQNAGLLTPENDGPLTEVIDKVTALRNNLQQAWQYLQKDSNPEANEGWERYFEPWITVQRSAMLESLRRVAKMEYDRLPEDSPIKAAFDLHLKILQRINRTESFRKHEKASVGRLGAQLNNLTRHMRGKEPKGKGKGKARDPQNPMLVNVPEEATQRLIEKMEDIQTSGPPNIPKDHPFVREAVISPDVRIRTSFLGPAKPPTNHLPAKQPMKTPVFSRPPPIVPVPQVTMPAPGAAFAQYASINPFPEAIPFGVPRFPPAPLPTRKNPALPPPGVFADPEADRSVISADLGLRTADARQLLGVLEAQPRLDPMEVEARRATLEAGVAFGDKAAAQELVSLLKGKYGPGAEDYGADYFPPSQLASRLEELVTGTVTLPALLGGRGGGGGGQR